MYLPSSGYVIAEKNHQTGLIRCRSKHVIRVLLIEDDADALARIKNALTPAKGIIVIGTAQNCAQGTEQIKRGGYDVLLCDLGLPDGSGIDLIRQSSLLHPDADIAVITVFAEQARVMSSIKAGARGYLLKDENIDECAGRIHDLRAGGSPISPIIARQLLRELVPASPDLPDDHGVTPREGEVLGLLAKGFSYAEIADLLGLSAQTIGTHVKNLYRKLEVSSRAEAVFEGSARGIIRMP